MVSVSNNCQLTEYTYKNLDSQNLAGKKSTKSFLPLSSGSDPILAGTSVNVLQFPKPRFANTMNKL